MIEMFLVWKCYKRLYCFLCFLVKIMKLLQRLWLSEFLNSWVQERYFLESTKFCYESADGNCSLTIIICRSCSSVLFSAFYFFTQNRDLKTRWPFGNSPTQIYVGVSPDSFSLNRLCPDLNLHELSARALQQPIGFHCTFPLERQERRKR